MESLFIPGDEEIANPACGRSRRAAVRPRAGKSVQHLAAAAAVVTEATPQ